MNNNPLVSIITPCYNGESYISTYLDSILNQTYPNIELILINDGSTDKTSIIINSYRNKFNEKGYKLILIEQENKGQSEAINQGLKIFKGEYLTWPDSDDYLSNDAIETKVKALEENPEYGLCICKTQMVTEFSKKYIGIQQRIKPDPDYDSLFIDLILGNNVYYSPGGYMVRSSMFRKVMPNPLRIEAPREIGQNFQLLLPISYYYKCFYIDKILYYYTVRHNSHSRQKHTYEQSLKIIEISYNVLVNICKHITKSQTEMQLCERLINERIINSYMKTMITYQKKDKLGLCFALSQKYHLPLKSIDLYKVKFYKLYKLLKYTKHIINRI